MQNEQFLAICLNPVLQKTIVLHHLWENEVNRSDEYYLDASGKGINVTRILQQLEEPVLHLTQIGGMHAELLRSLVRQDNLSVEWVEAECEVRSCYTLINSEKNTTTEIVEEGKPVGAGTEQAVLDSFSRVLPRIHTVIISGSKAAGYSDAIVPEMVKRAKEEGKKVILDIRNRDLVGSLPYKPDLIKPNLAEFYATFFSSTTPKESLEHEQELKKVKDKMKELYNEYGTVTVLTRGKHETLYIENGNVESIVPQSIVPVNTIGSGDAVTAGIAVALKNGETVAAGVERGHNLAKKNALLLRPGSIL
jgi:1-phosphofructokinase/tagatose 6-phosphate kinase